MDIEICCDGSAVMLGHVTSVGAVVLWAKGFGGVEDARVVGNEAVVAGAGTEDVGT